MRRTIALGAVAAAFIIGAPAPVSADGKGAQTETERFKDREETFVDVVPCVEPETPATITTVSNGVFHITTKDGTSHLTGTQEGTFTAVVGPTTYEGHFTIWFGENHNNNNDAGTFTFNVNGRSEEGDRVSGHLVGHFNSSASEPPHLNAFFQANCGRGNVTRESPPEE